MSCLQKCTKGDGKDVEQQRQQNVQSNESVRMTSVWPKTRQVATLYLLNGAFDLTTRSAGQANRDRPTDQLTQFLFQEASRGSLSDLTANCVSLCHCVKGGEDEDMEEKDLQERRKRTRALFTMNGGGGVNSFLISGDSSASVREQKGGCNRHFMVTYLPPSTASSWFGCSYISAFYLSISAP